MPIPYNLNNTYNFRGCNFKAEFELSPLQFVIKIFCDFFYPQKKNRHFLNQLIYGSWNTANFIAIGHLVKTFSRDIEKIITNKLISTLKY